MRASFAPLAEAVPKVFGPFGPPPPAAAIPEAAAASPPGPSAEEIERAFQAGVERGRAAARAELETVGTSFAGSLRELAGGKDLELVEDPSLPAGGCVIESRFGEIDIGVETQLERSERALGRATE